MQLEVYKILRTLMEEKDVDAFNIMFNEVIKKNLENDMTREFYSVSSEEKLKIIENSIKSIQPTLSATLAMKENQFLATENKCIQANKAVEPQKQLFPTRKRKRTAEHRAAKPSEEESHKIALSLIMNTK
ncbi:hypothetical protein NPIL_540691 [Nephila pilipes]|uniref:Uncharacterized protein n=1 Tax=Nephila pilipes TaxID=299642 RepID=A0A8X6M9V7_NEPPI|nr:hypothetical protein NPIL_155101 [Nephila pilipes]GFT19719.1 hypothetical protein NPIL_523731 [Nephila pilipes]GFT76307.1 hypothetical protein NPIL_501691 [Nephila pilipes]GFT97826.1 hypothetical protein NPIL_540691 [Nephila pilipes]